MRAAQLCQDTGLAEWLLARMHGVVLVAQQGKSNEANRDVRLDAAGGPVIDGPRRHGALEHVKAHSQTLGLRQLACIGYGEQLVALAAMAGPLHALGQVL